ncbi:MAG: FAD-binding oxidoreductase [Balneolaceae bacterium]|nr:MAG: FAD-binding oxidoreductase [Balneolaceae bacterium]
MILPESFDVIVLGAGISGLSVADAVLQQGKSCVIIDPNEPGGGASGAPSMLINPATGRRAKKAWNAEKAFELVGSLLHRIQNQSRQPFYEQNGVLRPALTEEIAKDFKRSLTKYEWDDGWLEWIDKTEFSRRFPLIGNHYGGLLVKKAITLLGNVFMRSYSRFLKKNFLQTDYGRQPQLFRIRENWYVDLGGGAEYTSSIVVDATGRYQTESEYWKFLPLHPVKGQLATYFFQNSLELDYSISSLGYMAVTKILPKQITVGSTYEHDFDSLKTTPQASAALQKKFEKTLPGLLGKSIRTRQWASVRVSLPDKMPVIGVHPEEPGLYIIGALGSRGMLLGRLAAEQLVQQMFHGISPDKEISVDRYV